jgi:hypothetical protein
MVIIHCPDFAVYSLLAVTQIVKIIFKLLKIIVVVDLVVSSGGEDARS